MPEFFGPLHNIINNALSFDLDRAFFSLFSQPEFKEMVLLLNRKKQLFKERVNSLGVKLSDVGGGYAAYTEDVNAGVTFTYEGESMTKQEGDSPNLYDSGEFYESFEVTVGIGFFQITADPIKDDGTNLFDEWGEDILGLTQESKTLLVEFLTPALQKLYVQAVTTGRIAA